MRAIRIIPQQVMSIIHNYTRIILKGEEVPELMNKDFLISPYEPKSVISFSPGSLYFYHHFEIPDYHSLYELEDLIGMDIDTVDEVYGSFPLHAYAFRFRPFREDVIVEQDDGDDFIHDAKYQASRHESIEMIDDPMLYDPRCVDNPTLNYDLRVILAWVDNNEDERAVRDGVDLDKIGHIVLREIVKRGLELDFTNSTELMRTFVAKHLIDIEKKNLYHEYFSMDEKRVDLFNRVILSDFLNMYSTEKGKPYISLTGDFMRNKFSEGFIDLHIDEETPNLMTELQVFQKFPKKMWNRLNFVYGDVTEKIPIFSRDDLSLMEEEEFTEEPEIVEIQKNEIIDEKFCDSYLEYPTSTASFSLNAVFHEGRMHLLLKKRYNGKCISTVIHMGSSKMTELSTNYVFEIEEEGFSNIKKQFFSEHWSDIKPMLSDIANKFHCEMMGKTDSGNWGKEGYGGEGYVIELDSGEIEFLSLTPNFHEYQFHGKVMDGRFIERKMYVDRGDEGVEERWFSYMSDSLPFVLSEHAVNENWITPYEISGLPKYIEDNIPTEYKYWTYGPKDSTNLRNELKKNMDELIAPKLKFNGILPLDTYYTIQEDLANDRWNINVLINRRIFTFICENNPIIMKTNASFKRQHNTQAMAFTSDEISMLDKGECRVIVIKENKFTVSLDGDIKGVFIFKRQSLSDIWDVERTNYETISQIQFENFMKVTETKKQKNGYLKLKGILFRPGNFKGKNYNASVVKEATLNAIHKGHSLPYINFFHNEDELSRIGIMTRIWWDANQKWNCGKTGKQFRGALMFEGIVTDAEGITAIMEKGTYQVSAEVAFQDYDNNVQKMVVTGVAICHSPAVDSAQIVSACYEGGRCIAFPVGVTPATT